MSDSEEFPDIESIDAAIRWLLYPELETQQKQNDVLVSGPPTTCESQHQPGFCDGQHTWYCEEISNYQLQGSQSEHLWQAPRSLYSTPPLPWPAPANPPQGRHQGSNSALALPPFETTRLAKKVRPILDPDNSIALRRLEDAKEELSTPYLAPLPSSLFTA